MIAAEQVLQDRRAASSLRAPRRVERHVMLTLKPLFEIPICEAVTNVVDDGSRQEFIRLSAGSGSRTRRADARPHRFGTEPALLRSFLVDDDVGRVGMLHSDDVIAGIDVMYLARNAARQIAEEIHGGIAHLLDRHAA